MISSFLKYNSFYCVEESIILNGSFLYELSPYFSEFIEKGLTSNFISV